MGDEMNRKIKEVGVNIKKLEHAFLRIENYLENLKSGCMDQQTLELAIRGELNHQRGHLQRLKRMFGLQ